MPRAIEVTLRGPSACTLALFFGHLCFCHHCPTFFDDPDESASHVRSCALWHAHGKSGACREELHKVSFIAVDALLHMSAALRLLWRTGERTTDRHCAKLLPALQGLGMGIVVERAASVEEQSRS